MSLPHYAQKLWVKSQNDKGFSWVCEGDGVGGGEAATHPIT